MELDYSQKRHLFEHGFVHLPGVVPPVMVNAARRAINASLGEKGMDPEQLPILRAQTYCPELRTEPAIMGLYTDTPAAPLAESAIGKGSIQPIKGGQIALRFPHPVSADPPREPRPHLDGMYSPTNGVPEGEIRNFTALVGVLLSDLPEPMSGNFTVWPGSHRLHEAYFRSHGPESLLQGMPKVDLPPPLSITGRAGDVVLVHYLLGHGIAPNYSPNIRYACFFRLCHVDHESQRWESMTHAWLQWPGIRAVAEA